ncbi:hypothetical protein [Agathobaculum sp.]|uniref:hypothetical protein n=1 Tax=Agathobaculum sp. TaxID=2048138 RepID=UPI002A8218B3|nr:hypothetical protein [Agathobaculum sp.]MDY3619267.1 hypothetical protein [Agathobaculum sp.]
MQNQEEQRCCAVCEHFMRHFYKLSSRNYRMTLYGHCAFNKRGKPHHQNDPACEKFTLLEERQA